MLLRSVTKREWDLCMLDFTAHPGLLYVVATMLPLAAFVLMLLAGGLKNLGRAHRDFGWGETLYRLFGGDRPGKGGAYLATAAIGTACILSIVGLSLFISKYEVVPAPSHGEEHHAGHPAAEPAKHDEAVIKEQAHAHDVQASAESERAWKGSLTWVKLAAPLTSKDDRVGVKLELGYYIDHLAAIMFAMVTFIATLIHIFAIGYMNDETEETVEDHHAVVHEETADAHGHHGDHAHFRRRGRYNRFFMFFVAVLLFDVEPDSSRQPASRCLLAGNWSASARICSSVSTLSGEVRQTRPTRRSSPTASATSASSSA